MSLASAMEAAVRAHVGVLQPALVVPDDVTVTTYEEAREVLGTNEQIAEQAGYGTPGEYPKGSPEWVARRSFMRQLQRAEKRRTGAPGESRSGASLVPRVVTVANVSRNRSNTPTTVRDVIRLMGMKGTTSLRFKCTVQVSADKRDRDIAVPIYVHPKLYRDVGWPMRGISPRSTDQWGLLAGRYAHAVLTAYGLAEGTAITGTGELFLFTIGREDGVLYDYS